MGAYVSTFDTSTDVLDGSVRTWVDLVYRGVRCGLGGEVRDAKPWAESKAQKRNGATT
jgi:hypothetical protein